MINRDEAKREVSDDLPLFTVEANSIVDLIYDTRGECQLCKWYENAHERSYCKHLGRAVHHEWFCGDFTEKDAE